jgi:hypothetical protein
MTYSTQSTDLEEFSPTSQYKSQLHIHLQTHFHFQFEIGHRSGNRLGGGGGKEDFCVFVKLGEYGNYGEHGGDGEGSGYRSGSGSWEMNLARREARILENGDGNGFGDGRGPCQGSCR